MDRAQLTYLYQVRYRPLVTKRQPHYALKSKNVNATIIYVTENIIKKIVKLYLWCSSKIENSMYTKLQISLYS